MGSEGGHSGLSWTGSRERGTCAAVREVPEKSLAKEEKSGGLRAPYRLG